MRSLPWLLFTLAVVLGGIWLTMRRGGTAYAEPVASAPSVPVENPVEDDPPPRSAAPEQVVATVPATVPATGDPFVALHRELDRKFGSHEERGVLERLIDLGGETGDERTYELVISTLANPGSKLFPSKSKLDILRHAKGSRVIEDFAAETILSSLADHEGIERTEVQSFQALLATNGLPGGIWTLVEQLAASDPNLVKGAVEALKSARPVDAGLREELREALFAELLLPRECAVRYELAQALLALDRVEGVTPGEPRSRSRLLEIAFEGAGVDLLPEDLENRDALAHEIRTHASMALAEAFDADTLQRSIAFYAVHGGRPPGDDPDAALRDQIPGMWQRLSAPDSDAIPEEVEAHRELLAPLEQYLLQAITSPQPPPGAHVRQALRGPAFQPLAPALEAALDELERD